MSEKMMIVLDYMGQRYGTRPSEIMGMPTWTGKSILFDMTVTKSAMEAVNVAAGTLGGKIKSSWASWPKNIQEEVRRQAIGSRT